MKRVKKFVLSAAVIGSLSLLAVSGAFAKVPKIPLTCVGRYDDIYLYRDDETGVEYFVFSSVTPRYDSNGKIFVDREYLKSAGKTPAPAPAKKDGEK